MRYAFTVLCLLQFTVQAQLDTTSHSKFFVTAGLLINRTFSNYPLKNESDDVSRTVYKAADSASRYKPGFFFGVEDHFLRSEHVKMIIGAFFSRSTASYHSSYTSSEVTTKTGYTHVDKDIETDYSLVYNALNFQAGLRFRLSTGFFLHTSFLVNSPLRITSSSMGYSRTTYSNNSGGRDSSQYNFQTPATRLQQKPADFSFRLGVSYALEIGDQQALLQVFRNFGLVYALPWWGIGFSYSLD